jgi:GT2 family glycosyltransferase
MPGIRENRELPITCSVIVPAWNAARTIGRCLDSLLDAARDDTEIIVVDDGSTDATASIASGKGARVLRRDHGGPAGARNAGAAVATGTYLVFVDSDVYVHADFIDEIGRVTGDDTEAAAIQCVYSDAIHPHTTASLYNQLFQRYLMTRARSSEVEEIGTFAVAIRRDAFVQVGGFDASFRAPLIEDIELGIRLNRAGHRIRFAQHIQVDHDCLLTTRDLGRKFQRSRAYASWFFGNRARIGGVRRQWSNARDMRSYISVHYLLSLLYLPSMPASWILSGGNRVVAVVVLALVILHASWTAAAMSRGRRLPIGRRIGLTGLRIMDGSLAFLGIAAGLVDAVLAWRSGGGGPGR